MPPLSFSASLTVAPNGLGDAYAEALRRVAARNLATAILQRDPSAWSSSPEVQARVGNRLGWVTSPELMARESAAITSFAEGVRRDGFTDVVLLGMGGSSLAPEVLRAVAGVSPGWPRFTMVDSVNPDHVRAVAADVHRTLFLFSSKSGSTIEPNVLTAHFRQRLLDAGVTRWADHFVAITDPGTALDRRAADEHFRHVFRNPPDIGGRYSAISFFGLVPAALMGLDVARMVADARAMLDQATSAGNGGPALALGALMGAGGLHGRDKLTLVLPDRLQAFGLWVEQLVAESTGKQGKGLVPIAGEPLGSADQYGDDRVIVRVRTADNADADDERADALLKALAARGVPIAEIVVERADALGGELVRWELATATAGMVLGIDPFDEPNVQQAKDATRALLDTFTKEGRLPVPEPDAEADHAAYTLTSAARKALAGRSPDRVLDLTQPGDYVGVLAYLPESAEITAAVSAFRARVRARTRCATMFGYGPRYLHSTGQLHKGGPNTGVFLLLTAPGQDLPVPGEPFSFGVLELAQALGDLASLDHTGRRALHVHLPRPDAGTVQAVLDRLASA